MGIKVRRFKVGELVKVQKPSGFVDYDTLVEVLDIPIGIIFKKCRTVDHFYTVYYNDVFYPNVHALGLADYQSGATQDEQRFILLQGNLFEYNRHTTLVSATLIHRIREILAKYINVGNHD